MKKKRIARAPSRDATANIRLRLFRLYGLLLALVAGVAGCAQSVKHDEAVAAKEALEFARMVFLDKNLDGGYNLLAPGGRRHIPLDKFKQTISAMHPRGYPDKVIAIEYEPMVGEAAIYIFLIGRNAEEQSFNYRVTMEGSATTGYKVLKIDQGGGFPSLSNQKRAFKPTLQIP